MQSHRPQHHASSRRIIAIDISRSAALIAMIVYHFFWDLTALSYLPPSTMHQNAWVWFSRLIAVSFLFLSGVSLWLAHCQGIRWKAFSKRLAVLILAALAISLATRVAFPTAWIRFGILHAIAASTIIGLAFLHAPLPLLGGVVLAILAANSLQFDALNGPLWIWTGLGASGPFMLDYEPLVPWLAACLLGVLLARIFSANLQKLQRKETPFLLALAWPGKHSLPIYLIHQPLIYGGLYAAKWADLG